MKYELDQKDINMLQLVYNMRCLTVKQAYHRCYENEISLEELVERLNEMEKQHYIKLTAFNGNYAILIDEEGYKFLKDSSLVREVIDADTGKIKKGYNTPRENSMQAKAINHQVHLNEFVIQFEDSLKDIPLNIESEYFDEKNVSKYEYMRPDGLLSVKLNKNKIDFFLEMDMATESAKQLEDKWVRYKNFLKSDKFYKKSDRIVVLFIIANTNKVDERRRLILKTILDKFEGFNPRFEIYVGEKDELIDLMYDLIINKPDYKFYLKEMFLDKFKLQSNLVTNICSLNTYRNKIFNYIETDSHIFLYDNYETEPVSVLDKIQNISLYISEIKEKTNKIPMYLINVKNIEKLYDDIKYLKLMQLDNLIFTTSERIMTKPINEALFIIMRDGSIRHFDKSFKNLIFEEVIKEEDK